jgi:uncharacterized protein
VKPYLLDTNVLIALAWPEHVFHRDAQSWFARKRAAGFRTCPITEMGFVRISSNTAFVKGAVSPGQALDLLRRITRLREHEFWPDDLPLREAVGKTELAGHRQVTDAYLLALAARHGGVLATLDRAVLELSRRTGHAVELVELR